MGYKNIIDNFKPIEYSKTKDITSYEKLMLYAANELNKSKIPLTFNYVCIASFKLFPEHFCCDEEFKEFPSIDRLNRTYMHLKYVKKGKSFIAGTMKDGFTLTRYGQAMAEEVKALIDGTEIDKTVKPVPIDAHKKGNSQYYTFINSDGYKNFLETKSVDLKYIWKYFDVAPYTKIKRIKDTLELILQYAEEYSDYDCVNYVNNVKKMI